MKLKNLTGGLLLASLAAVSLAGIPFTAEAGPPLTPPGQANKSGFAPKPAEWGSFAPRQTGRSGILPGTTTRTPPGVARNGRISPFVPQAGTARDIGRSFAPPGLAGQGGFPPGAQKFGYGRFCPPGLSDKGCLPPGLHQFAGGDSIPGHVRYTRLPYQDFGLPAPGPGRFYAGIGDEAYLVTESTQRVIEAFSLLGALGR